jgi:hypothetical protein
MAWVYGLVSLGGILALHALGCGLLRVRWLSLALALWFCISPDVLLFNEKLFYDGLVPWLLCMGFWGIWAGLDRRSVWRLVFGFAMLAAVVLLRSMFHPLWLLVATGLAVAVSGCRWRVVACAAPGLAVVAAVLVKNLVLFGFLGLSSWATLNLVGVTVEKLPSAERAALVADGTLSPLAAVDAFGGIEKLLPLLPSIPATGQPSLDNPRKSNGHPNMNHMAMLVASRMRGGDALASVRADPGMYAAVLMFSAYTFHRPANEFRDVRRNLAHIRGWTRLVNATLGLQPVAWAGSSLDTARPPDFWMQISYGALAITLLFLAASWRTARFAVAALRMRQALPPDLIAVAMLCWTGLFVIAVSSAFDTLENNRARYTVAPILTLGALWFVVQRVHQWQRRPSTHALRRLPFLDPGH